MSLMVLRRLCCPPVNIQLGICACHACCSQPAWRQNAGLMATEMQPFDNACGIDAGLLPLRLLWHAQVECTPPEGMEVHKWTE